MKKRTAEELKVGDPAPDFSLPAGDGTTVSLKAFRGAKTVVLYFYPKDDTPGCTREACDFRDAVATFAQQGVVILGISPDDPASHAAFREKYHLPFRLLSDEGAAISKQYGVYKRRVLYGRPFLGIERTTFVIGADGRIQQIYRRVKVDGHIQKVLAAVTAGGT